MRLEYKGYDFYMEETRAYQEVIPGLQDIKNLQTHQYCKQNRKDAFTGIPLKGLYVPLLLGGDRGGGNCLPSAYPPSPAAEQQLAQGNDRPPRSPLRRKECIQESKGLGSMPVLGPLPSLSPWCPPAMFVTVLYLRTCSVLYCRVLRYVAHVLPCTAVRGPWAQGPRAQGPWATIFTKSRFLHCSKKSTFYKTPKPRPHTKNDRIP